MKILSIRSGRWNFGKEIYNDFENEKKVIDLEDALFRIKLTHDEKECKETKLYWCLSQCVPLAPTWITRSKREQKYIPIILTSKIELDILAIYVTMESVMFVQAPEKQLLKFNEILSQPLFGFTKIEDTVKKMSRY